MDEDAIRETFARMRTRLEKGEEPDERDVLQLAEGMLVNLARIAAHA